MIKLYEDKLRIINAKREAELKLVQAKALDVLKAEVKVEIKGG